MIVTIQWCMTHGAQIKYRTGECWSKKHSRYSEDHCRSVDAMVIIPSVVK